MHKPFCDSKTFPKSCQNMLLSLAKKSKKPVNAKLIKSAFVLARDAHKGQVRISKEPYFSHPLETAAILANLGLSCEIIAAALLHDVLEDTEIKASELRKRFGREVSSMVEGVTKLDLLASESRTQNTMNNFHSLLFATTKDPRVILIKLADKLHNLRTLHHLPARDRKRIGNEALLFYVPIAHKIGLEEMALEMEDLAFENAKPETFKSMERNLKPIYISKGYEIGLVTAILKKKLKKAKFFKSQRSVYGVYTKMHNTGKILDQLNDCVILNVVVKTEPGCYSALGVIHSVFPPLPNKVKDFIASPKPSLYKLLQTSVFGPEKKPVKIRIMTKEMDEVNRLGVIAFRRIFGERMSKEMQQSLSNLGSILSNGNNEQRFMTALKADFLTRPIFVFTSKGKLVELPKKSTVLDFAFATEKNWALHLLKAKINGKRVSLGSVLESGQVVELFFGKKPRFKKDWLMYANGFNAKNALKKALKKRKGKH